MEKPSSESSIEKFWRERFLQYGAIREIDEKHGDFVITLGGKTIGFEVYCPKEPLSLGVRKAVKGDNLGNGGIKHTKIELPDGNSDWILTTDLIDCQNSEIKHSDQLLQKVFDSRQKQIQFSDKRVFHSKILIIDLSFEAFISCEIHGFKAGLDSASFNPHCAAAYFVAKYVSFEKNNYIKNLNAIYPLTNTEHAQIRDCLRS